MANKYSLSFDISTTNVGMAVWDGDGKLVELKHLSLDIKRKEVPSEDRYIYKANLFGDYLKLLKERLLEEYDATVEHLFVEAPLSNTPKNINTTAMLLGFNGIACYKLYEIFDIIPKKITVYESRKLFCPELTKTKKVKGEIKTVLSFPKGFKSDQKKEYLREKVEKLEPQIQWFYTRNNTIKSISYDMSDAYVVGFAGLKVIGVL